MKPRTKTESQLPYKAAEMQQMLCFHGFLLVVGMAIGHMTSTRTLLPISPINTDAEAEEKGSQKI